MCANHWGARGSNKERTMKKFSRFRFWIFILLFGLVSGISAREPRNLRATNNLDAPLAQATTLSVESLLNSDGSLNFSRNLNGALDLRGWNVTLDSTRGPVLARESSAPAAPLDAWSSLPHNGLNGPVLALAVWEGDLYVGGVFSGTADGPMPLNSIARFNGTNWSALPNNGLNGGVRALAVATPPGGGESTLYVGGYFTATKDGTIILNNIAEFDGTNWSALPNNGLDNSVRALAVWESDLYVGGDFSQTADEVVTNLNYIARFDGTNWSPLSNNGLNDIVRAMTFSTPPGGGNTTLYVGGGFERTNDSAVTLNHIARFDGTNWSALPNNGLNENVYALAVATPLGGGEETLYVGGYFTRTVDGAMTGLKHIARFTGGAWFALPNNGLDFYVFALAISTPTGGGDATLYVGGNFTQTRDGTVTNLNNVAKFSGGVWSALPGNGLNDAVTALAVWTPPGEGDMTLSVGGFFTATANGAATPALNHVAKLVVPSLSLASFSARAKIDRVLVEWETTNELGLVGFNLWRRDGKNSEFAKLNADLIPVLDSPIGNSYVYKDKTVQPDRNFHYQLELVKDNVQSEWSGLARVYVPPVCSTAPIKAKLRTPENGTSVKRPHQTLGWESNACATTYEVTVREGSPEGKVVDSATGLTAAQDKTIALKVGKTYYWRVRACNDAGCGKWSAAWNFQLVDK